MRRVLWTVLLLLLAVVLTAAEGNGCLETAQEEAQEVLEQAATEVAKQQTAVAELQTPVPSPDTDGQLSDGSFLYYVASGDSVAYGADMPRSTPYGLLLFNARLQLEFGPSTEYTNIAVSGQTPVDYIKNQLPRIVELKPDLVTVTIGANDILSRLQENAGEVGRDPQCGLDEQLTRQNLNVILFGIVERTEALAAVTTYYNPLAGTLGEIAQGCLDILNGFIRAASESVNRRYPGRTVLVDISDAFDGREWVVGGASTDTYVQDCGDLVCVHPNEAGHAKIAEMIWSEVEGSLRGSP